MNTAETLILLFEDGLPMFTKSVEAVPEGKRDWKPAEGSRSVRQLTAEVVMMPEYVAKTLTERGVPPYEEMVETYADMSIPRLLNRLRANAQEYYAALRAFPEAAYEETLEAPWGVWTYFQTMSYPYWNLVWHTGQINYIQTLYGDQNFY